MFPGAFGEGGCWERWQWGWAARSEHGFRLGLLAPRPFSGLAGPVDFEILDVGQCVPCKGSEGRGGLSLFQLLCPGGLAKAWGLAKGSSQVRGTLVTVAREQSSGARRAASLLLGVTLERSTSRVAASWLLPRAERGQVRISCRADCGKFGLVRKAQASRTADGRCWREGGIRHALCPWVTAEWAG